MDTNKMMRNENLQWKIHTNNRNMNKTEIAYRENQSNILEPLILVLHLYR